MAEHRIKDICNSNARSVKGLNKDIEIQYLETSDLTCGECSNLQPILLKNAPSRAQRLLSSDTIVYSMVRPNLCHYGYFENPPQNLVVSTGFLTLNLKPQYIGIIDPHFVYLLLTQPWLTQYLHTIAQNAVSSYPSLNPSDVECLCFEFPDFEIQRRFADLFFKIDRKIALNREINRNLEAMARQLYDYWFVQFDFPDENGRPYKSSGGKMVWNEKLKREIPEGWMSKMIRDMSEIQRESCTPNVSLDTIYHLFSIPAFDKTGAYVLESGTEIQSDKFVITKDDILISKLNPWTSRVVWCGDYPNQIASTEFVVLRPRIEDRGYLYMALKDPKLIAYASKGATGTSNSHKRVNPEFLTAYRIPYEPSVVRKFSESINSIQNQLLKNRNEINILITQREELLPLLINGQVSVMPTAVNCDLFVLVEYQFAYCFSISPIISFQFRIVINNI